MTRLLAYLLEYTEGIEFSRGVSEPDEPAIAIRDLTGRITTWIDIGTPDAARLHKAAKSGARVVVYTHKNPEQFLKQLSGEKIHRPDELELYTMDRRSSRRSPRDSSGGSRSACRSPTASCTSRSAPTPSPAPSRGSRSDAHRIRALTTKGHR